MPCSLQRRARLVAARSSERRAPPDGARGPSPPGNAARSRVRARIAATPRGVSAFCAGFGERKCLPALRRGCRKVPPTRPLLVAAWRLHRYPGSTPPRGRETEKGGPSMTLLVKERRLFEEHAT